MKTMKVYLSRYLAWRAMNVESARGKKIKDWSVGMNVAFGLYYVVCWYPALLMREVLDQAVQGGQVTHINPHFLIIAAQASSGLVSLTVVLCGYHLACAYRRAVKKWPGLDAGF